MMWDDFYDRYSNWSESTLKTRISSLEEIGNGEEVVDVCMEVCDEKIKSQLIRKAMKLGVKFSQEDLMNLDGELSEALFEEVTRYAGFSSEYLYFDEHHFDWDDFFAVCSDLPEDILLRCIPRLKRMGDRDEVVEAILSVSASADDALYLRAIECGVEFTQEQLEQMGREDILFVDEFKKFSDLPEEQMNHLSEQIHMAEKQADEAIEQMKKPKKRVPSMGKAIGFGVLIGLFLGLSGGKRKHHRHCNHDCAHCPAHFGYRYGRWYYGHGHQYGCEFGGNRGGG